MYPKAGIPDIDSHDLWLDSEETSEADLRDRYPLNGVILIQQHRQGFCCNKLVDTDVNIRVIHPIAYRNINRSGGGYAIVWAAISHTMRTDLGMFGTTLTTYCYIDEILQPHILPIMIHVIFQHNNARPHKSCQRFYSITISMYSIVLQIAGLKPNQTFMTFTGLACSPA